MQLSVNKGWSLFSCNRHVGISNEWSMCSMAYLITVSPGIGDNIHPFLIEAHI